MKVFMSKKLKKKLRIKLRTIVQEILIMCHYYLIPRLYLISLKTEEAIIACAVKFEKTRLIDNIIMSTKG